jgi:hypothetical protein
MFKIDLYMENDSVEHRVRGQNSKRVDRDAISRQSRRGN